MVIVVSVNCCPRFNWRRIKVSLKTNPLDEVSLFLPGEQRADTNATLLNDFSSSCHVTSYHFREHRDTNCNSVLIARNCL
ncbi:hypothetical protein PUN28_004711 [Cardiocondyla obscurior]|uniref:Uncharacterized protein n=1 Tax=Cardiocondyla obscurior TaxID=286306 RepID=A0AAW2GEZ9_9HYME